jgi:hypothetical protein
MEDRWTEEELDAAFEELLAPMARQARTRRRRSADEQARSDELAAWRAELRAFLLDVDRRLQAPEANREAIEREIEPKLDEWLRRPAPSTAEAEPPELLAGED